MGRFDVPAMLKTIKYTIQQDVENPRIEYTDKVLYIGYDQGATQLLYGLSYLEDSFYKDYVRGAILLAPCVKMNVLKGTLGQKYYKNLMGEIDMMGLYGLTGHDWQMYKPELCAHLSRDWCEQERTWEEEAYSARSLTHLI